MSGWAAAPLLDAGQFGGYAEFLLPAQMAALVAAYRHELATRPAQLSELVDRGDLASVKVAAHRLKGASLTMGACRIAALAGAIEEAGAAVLPALAAALPGCARETAAEIAGASPPVDA